MGDVVRGPWPAAGRRDWPVPPPVDPSEVRWRRGRPAHPAGSRRLCRDCARPFDSRGWIPGDLLCGECRIERERPEPHDDPDQPGLFPAGVAET